MKAEGAILSQNYEKQKQLKTKEIYPIPQSSSQKLETKHSFSIQSTKQRKNQTNQIPNGVAILSHGMSQSCKQDRTP